MVQTRGVTLNLKQDRQDDDRDGTLQDDGAVEQSQLFTSDESDDFETPPPTKKHRGKRVGTKKIHQGEPFNPACMNLDILWHMCSFLTPMDVLNLARTCKYFRWILMSKSSLSIWKAALHEVEGLPNCPADLTEPEYTNLVFNPRCHGCGKYTPAIFWRIRRRYCPECRHERLLYINGIPQHIHIFVVVWPVTEDVSLSKGKRDMRCDKEQVNSWMKEYEQCSDKDKFLADKRMHNYEIRRHAGDCMEWHKLIASNRKSELRARRQERANSILERLEQLGFKREIDHFGPDHFWRSHKLTSKSLTEEEWTWMLPEWLATMGKSRQLRLESTVFRLRRLELEIEYRRYIAHCSPDTPSFDMLPNGSRLARFPPFKDIIEAPEETTLDDNSPFASAFAQLPPLVDEWRKQVEAELAGLVKIPCLASDNAACDNTDVASNQTDLDKLQLACALFSAGSRGVFTHPEVLLACTVQEYYAWRSDDFMDWGQFGIAFFEEAPYIIRACGLDPNLATPDDMDRRNARLKCLSLCCKLSNPLVMNWRTAIVHANSRHRSALGLAPLSESPRWQLVSNEWIHAIQTAEFVDFNPASSFPFMRCLLCSPCVGAAMQDADMIIHLAKYHQVNSGEGELGVHYALLMGIKDPYSTYVEMVEEGGEVTFRKMKYSWFSKDGAVQK